MLKRSGLISRPAFHDMVDQEYKEQDERPTMVRVDRDEMLRMIEILGALNRSASSMELLDGLDTCTEWETGQPSHSFSATKRF